LIATLIVLGTEDARLNGIGFAAGFILGQAAGIGIPLLVGVIITSSFGENGDVITWLELALGVLMILGAFRVRVGGVRRIPDESRTAVLLVRLERVRPATAFSFGVPLGVGAKRLLISILAASTIALSASTRTAELRQGAIYVVIASVLVWLPVAVYFILGPRADEWVAVSRRWVLENQREMSFYLALVFGVLFTVDAAVKLQT
jgi:hypothetical protein